jgi:hypothetical protein
MTFLSVMWTTVHPLQDTFKESMRYIPDIYQYICDIYK